jgi:hypothetical protein
VTIRGPWKNSQGSTRHRTENPIQNCNYKHDEQSFLANSMPAAKPAHDRKFCRHSWGHKPARGETFVQIPGSRKGLSTGTGEQAN